MEKTANVHYGTEAVQLVTIIFLLLQMVLK